MADKNIIDALLKDYPYLKCNSVYGRSVKFVKKIIQMKEWDDPKFQGLLTSTIWNSNYENISAKIHLPIWENPNYEHLLTSTIFVIKADYIEKNIEIAEKNNLIGFIKTNTIRRNPIDFQNLIEFLIKNTTDLVIDNKLNPILNASTTTLKKKYGIDLKELCEEMETSYARVL